MSTQMFPMMMQSNSYQRGTAMNTLMNQNANCFGNYYNNNYIFPQQKIMMSQQIAPYDSMSNFNNNNQINFMIPQIQRMPNINKQQPSNFLKEKKSTSASTKTKIHDNNKKGSRNQFSKEEDQQLLELVEKYGDKKWKIISKHMPNRTTRQCHERYKYFLSPKLSNHPWTDEECMILELKYQELGPKWAEIAQFLNNRSAVSVKNKWGALERKKQLRAMIPLLNELYLTNHKILKGINIKKYNIKPKRVSHIGNEKEPKTDGVNYGSQDEDNGVLSDLFNDESDEAADDGYESVFFDNESENLDDDFLSLWDNENMAL